MPIIEAIENIAAPTIEKSLANDGLSDEIAATLKTKDHFSFDEMLAVLKIKKNEKGGIGAQKQTQFDYVKQRVFEQTGETWQWEGAPKDGYWVRVYDANIAAPSIEKSLPTEALSDAIAASAKPKAKRSAKSKPCYTRDDLESIKLVDLRKLVTTAVPIDLRKGIKQKDMDKNLIIDLILKAQTHT